MSNLNTYLNGFTYSYERDALIEFLSKLNIKTAIELWEDEEYALYEDDYDWVENYDEDWNY